MTSGTWDTGQRRDECVKEECESGKWRCSGWMDRLMDGEMDRWVKTGIVGIEEVKD